MEIVIVASKQAEQAGKQASILLYYKWAVWPKRRRGNGRRKGVAEQEHSPLSPLDFAFVPLLLLPSSPFQSNDKPLVVCFRRSGRNEPAASNYDMQRTMACTPASSTGWWGLLRYSVALVGGFIDDPASRRPSHLSSCSRVVLSSPWGEGGVSRTVRRYRAMDNQRRLTEETTAMCTPAVLARM